MSDQPVSIELGQTGESFVLANGRARVNVDRQPAGVNFYQADWPVNRPGTARIEQGQYSFKVEHAVSVMGAEDTKRTEDGISTFWVKAILAPPQKGIPHLEARDQIMALLHMLQAVGWRRYIVRSDPRFKGRAAVEESTRQLGIYSLDPSYTPTLNEWMQLDDHAMWYLYADGVYLTVDFRRNRERMNPKEPGAYLLGFELKSEAMDSKEYFAPEDRDRWLELWPEREKALQRERAEAEAKARAQGRQIDTGYSDPPVLAVQKRTPGS